MAELDPVNSAEREDRNFLVLEHIPLLRHIVGRMLVPGGLDRDDLYGFGMLGLIAAADSFEPERGLEFSTYAYPKIRGAILDEVRRSDFLPRGWRERVRALDRVVAQLEQENGIAPTPEELAERMGVAVDEVDETLASARGATEVSLDEEWSSSQLSALLSDPRSEDPVGSAEWLELKQLLVEFIQALPEQEKTVITLYYGESLLLRDISQVLGVTESRVSQIHSRALYRLNRALSPVIGAQGE
jgi:RNA polymerase sigma factor for flagellar operon FliA